MRKNTHILKKLLFMLNTIYRTGGISRKDLVELWEKDTEETIAQRTFAKYMDDIEEIFDINIDYNASKDKYYIEDTDELNKGTINQWLLTSFSINNMMAESRKLNKRILFETIPCGNEYLTTIVQAMKENVCLKIVYQGFHHESPFTVVLEPYCVKVFKKRWYMIVMHQRKQEIRMYALDRIHHMELTDMHFEMPEDFDAAMYFYNSYGILVQPDEFDVETVVMKVSNQRNKCDYLRLLPLHHSQKEIEKHDGYSIFTVQLYPTLDFIQEILSHGDEIEIISPLWVRKDVASYIRVQYQTYKDAIEILDKEIEEEERLKNLQK